MKRLLSILLIVFLTVSQSSWTVSSGREVSKAGQVFEQVKDGVVTVFTSAGHGSGFLVDASGLIMTNSHVVNETGGHLRVKFGQNQIVEGQLVENDREHDVAIIKVNLHNIKNYKILEPFVPTTGDTLVVVGENIIVVGSPLERETLEKTMTAGIVGKYERDIINHDANTNPGNSGGPVVNYDGKVVGIHSFSYKPDGTNGVPGAVAVTKGLSILEKAKAKVSTLPPVSDELLPDIPEVAYPISELLKEKPNLFPKRKLTDYNFQSHYFTIATLTPPQGYRQLVKLQDKELKRRKTRAKKKGFEISDDEYNYKNFKYYDYHKPVVTFWVVPKPKLTTGSKIFNTFAFVAAAGVTAASFGAGAPLMAAPFMMGKHEVKKDFLQMTLQTPDGKIACSPLETGRVPFEKNLVLITGGSYQDYVDKSYMGAYSYDAKCFENTQPLKMVIDIEGTKDDNYNIKVPPKTQKIIVDDFKPYYDYVAKLNQPAPPAAGSTTTVAAPQNQSDLLKEIIEKNSKPTESATTTK